MKGATTFTGRVEGGKLRLDNRAAFDRFTRLLDGKRVELQLRKYQKKRSLPQNRTYWDWIVTPLAEHVGLEPEQMHEELKRHFLAVRIDEHFARVRSTTELTTVEFSRYMEDCQRLAAECGKDLPLPDEVAA